MDYSESAEIEAIIADIEEMLRATRRDLAELRNMGRLLDEQYKAEKISYLHYTVDKERIRRTISKAKLILKILAEKRKRAMEIKDNT